MHAFCYLMHRNAFLAFVHINVSQHPVATESPDYTITPSFDRFLAQFMQINTCFLLQLV